MTKKKVALGLSGGVDSAVSAKLLLDQGYNVTTIFLECWKTPGCRAEEDRKDALKIAQQLNLPFQVLDFKEAYKTKVINKFLTDFKKGLTPNPDVWCNQVIKFGLFYDWAMEHKFDYVATGHYAGISNKKSGNQTIHNLTTPKDLHKDQTYFLHQIKEEQLSHVIFPLQKLSKDEVRKLAVKNNFHVANKKDSVGLCFVGDVNVGQMLKERLGENHGEVIDTEGNSIGKHKGLWFYTIGQRHGFTINSTTSIKQSDGTVINKHNIPPFYVVGKRTKQNQLIVGFGEETKKDNFLISQLHCINSKLGSTFLLSQKNLLVRIRHTGDLLPCKIIKKSDHIYRVQLNEAARGIAPGQYAVFYISVDKTSSGQEYICLGGGMIHFD